MRKDRLPLIPVIAGLGGIAVGIGISFLPLNESTQSSLEPIPTIPSVEAGIGCTDNATPVNGEGDYVNGTLHGIENGSVCVYKSK